MLTLIGHIAPSGYTMKGQTDRATETTSNDGLGNPVIYTGMIRSTFRPSDGELPYFLFLSAVRSMTAKRVYRRNHLPVPHTLQYDVCTVPLRGCSYNAEIGYAEKQRLGIANENYGFRDTRGNYKTRLGIPSTLWRNVCVRGRWLWQPGLFRLQRETLRTEITSEYHGRCQPPKSAVSINDGLREPPRRSLHQYKTICP